MYTKKNNRFLKILQVFFISAILWALFFSSCAEEGGGGGLFSPGGGLTPPGETGGDSDSTLPLAGPRSVQATGNDGALVLQWTKVAPAQGIDPYYEVYYGTSANSDSAVKWPIDVQPDDSRLVKVTITGLTNGQPYYAWVRAVFPGLGASGLSPAAYGAPIPPPVTPTGLTLTPSEGMLELNWPMVPDAFTYKVYYKAGGSGLIPPGDAGVETVSVNGAVLPFLTNGTSYRVWVQAVNTAGVSAEYAAASGVPAAAASAPAAAPVITSVRSGSGKLILTWDQVSGVPKYKIFYSATNNSTGATPFTPDIPANAPTVTAELTGLANTNTYYVWVKSSNSKGDSGFSPVARGKPEAKAPINFSNLSFKLGEAAAEYIFAQDLPPSVFFPPGRPNTDRLTRVQETALGDLFTDAAAWYVREVLKKPVDFVFLNGGYIDNALSGGDITVGDLAGIVQPDSRGDKIFFLTLTGAELILFFEDVADVTHTGRGGPHNTGFFGLVSQEVRYTIKYPVPPGGTVAISDTVAEPYYHGIIKPGTSVTINGTAINPGRNYRICTTDYLAAGEYFTRFYTAGTDKETTTVPFWHGVAEYIYNQDRITPKLDGRIKIEGGVPLPPPWIPGV